MSNEQPPTYSAYLVRLWRASDTSGERVILQDAHSEQQLLFNSLEGLFLFLKSGVAEPQPTPTPPLSDVLSKPDSSLQAGPGPA